MRTSPQRLICDHCHCEFLGSPHQHKHQVYEGRKVYCGPICRKAAYPRKPIPERGPCLHCGKMYTSKTAKMFCSISCYSKSDMFKAMLVQNREKILANDPLKRPLAGHMIKCEECGTEFYKKPRQRKRFCKRTCWRAWLAKRFDRYIANPEGLAMPQNFDEFLEQEQLPCLMEGCNWRGLALSSHMNNVHNVQARDFKRAAGFNLKTGVIAKPLAIVLQGRDRQGVAVDWRLAVLAKRSQTGTTRNYRSKESSQHSAEARLLAGEQIGPTRKCRGCNQDFIQTTIFGKALFCSIPCRTNYHVREDHQKAMERLHARVCRGCGTQLKNTGVEYLHAKNRIFCGVDCREAYYKQARLKKSELMEQPT